MLNIYCLGLVTVMDDVHQVFGIEERFHHGAGLQS